MQTAMKVKDLVVMDELFTDNGLFCGTAPTELFDKSRMMSTIKEMFAVKELNLDYQVDTRKIQISKNGKSAIALEQATFDFISPHVPVRSVYHLVKMGKSWKVGFYSVALIPANEDIPKINRAF